MKLNRVVVCLSTLLLASFFVGCGASTAPIAVSVSAASKATDQGMTVAITAMVAHDAKSAGVQWTVSGGGTLTNATAGTATFVAPANVTSAFTATVTATSMSDTTKAASVQIAVNPLPSITTNPALTATAGTAYSSAINASGGTAPFTWSVTGTLPPGLSIGTSTTNSVTISGTPTGGNATVTIKVADAVGSTSSQQFTITVNAAPALAITNTSLAAGVTGTAYSQTLAATGGVKSYTWAISSGSLPAGLSLNSSSGAITGTPTGPLVGTISFTVQVTDSGTPTHNTKSAALSIAVSAPALSVTTTSLAGGTLGTAYSASVAATGGITPYAWSVSAGSLPAGLTLNASTGAITGTPTGNVTGPVSFTVKVTDAETPTALSATANLSITITAPPLSVTTTTLPTGVVNSTYSATLQATGGVSPYSWAVTTGTLPAGLSLNASTGAITGTPTASGTANLTFTVTDSQSPTAGKATANLSITVNPQLAVTTSSLAAGVTGTAYSQTLAATGGITPYTWAVTTGSLPAGLSLNSSTGAITGTPTGPQVGAISFTVTVTDKESPAKTATANLSITISAPALSVTTTSLPGGTLGTAYSQTLAASGGITPYAWSISVGSLPQGLTLNASTGLISGTPTGSTTGAINFTVKVTDAETPTAQSATQALSITIAAAPLSVATTSLPSGVAQSVYAGATLQAAGGVSPYTWTVTTGSLPTGLTLNTTTGAISGTPTASGTTTFTVTATDSETPTAQTANKQLSITVNPQLSVTTTSLAAGVIGTAYSQTVAASGGITPYTWSISSGSLPAGLSLNSSTGAITGTPTGPAVGTSSFTVMATDSESPQKTATASLSIAITAPALNITTTSLMNGVVNQSYSATLAATGGVTPYTWALINATTLPAGLSLNASTGAITGTPTATGTTNFTVQVTDSETPTAQSTTANLSITVNNPVPVGVITTSLPAAVVLISYSTTLQASNGVSPYTWSITSGSLPSGLTLNTSTGAITGTPTASGTSSFTVKVTDSSKPTAGTATANLSITVNAALSITTTSLPAGSVGAAYASNVNASGGLGPYTWTITGGSLPAGLTLGSSTNSSDSISGTPTATGNSSFTVTVTDSESPAAVAHASLSINITAQSCTNNASLTGHYAMLLQGWTNSSAGEVFFGAAGSFVADGAGNISSGLVDANDASGGPGSGTFTGTYCIASNNLGTLNMSSPQFGTATLALSVQASGAGGSIIFYDTGNIQASGQFYKQDTTAFATSKFSGNYSLGLIGVDTGSGNRIGAAGRFTANGTANLTAGAIDADDNGNVSSNISFNSSNFSVGANGRGTVSINITNVGTFNFAFYVVNSSQLLMVASDPGSLGLFTGQVIKQSGLTGTDSDLNGVGVLELQGVGPSVTAGLVTANGSGSFSLSADQNQAGTMSTLSFTNGTFAVSSNGRVTLTGGGNHPPVLYLTGKNSGFVVGTDNAVVFGMLEAQSGAPFSLSSLSGNFYGGSLQPVASTVGEEVDQVNLSSGTVNVIGDFNSTQSNGSGNPAGNSFTGNYTVATNGKVTVTSGGTASVYVYIISTNQFVVLPVGDSNPKIEIFQH